MRRTNTVKKYKETKSNDLTTMRLSQNGTIYRQTFTDVVKNKSKSFEFSKSEQTTLMEALVTLAKEVIPGEDR